LRTKEDDRDRCPYCKSEHRRHCPIHGKSPRILPSVRFYVRLWNRVKRYKHLPEAGGLLDQDEDVMRALDIISEEVEADELKKQKLEAARKELGASPEAQRVLRG
jgi:hypothetical protein